MRTSLVIPPASPTTAASTTTPNRSSFARTAASPPLRPKTNVPARLRTRMSGGLKPTGTSIGDERSRRPAPGREERDPPGGPSSAARREPPARPRWTAPVRLPGRLRPACDGRRGSCAHRGAGPPAGLDGPVDLAGSGSQSAGSGGRRGGQDAVPLLRRLDGATE